jgi:hypothetical protein
MNAIRRNSSLLSFALLVTAVYATEILTVRLAIPRSSSPGLLAAAVAFDLVVVVPGAYWFMRLRGRRPAARVMPVFLLSLMGAAAVLPATYRGMVPLVRLVAAPAELVLMGMIVLRARQAFRSAPAAGADAAERIREAAIAALPYRAAAEIIAYELSLMYYALLGWRARPSVDGGTFGYHVKSGYGGIVFALAAATVVEGSAVHLLVHGSSALAAWILSGISAYGLLWLLGDYQAVRLRPMVAGDDALRLRVGLRWSATVPWSVIAALKDAGRAPLPKRAPGWLRMTVIGQPKLVLELRRPVEARGPYGITRRVERIGLTVDDAVRFRAEVERRLSKQM